MTNYRRKSIKVKAWQVGSDEPIPTWILHFSIMGPDGEYRIVPRSGPVLYVPFEWFVIKDGELYSYVSPREFERNYEQI